jgi:predicted short-subunit dehydrogenase-like oxidoreductase (DUF2520 family)
MRKPIVLVGCGKAGLSLSLALKSSGWTVSGCLSRTFESARQGSQWLACPVLPSLGEVPQDAAVILGVPEGQLPEVDRQLASADPHISGRLVIHLSGALPARVLESCRLRGASVGSLHAIMTLPDPLTGARRLRNATFALEGRPGALELMRAMAQSLSGRMFILSPRGKTLYHASAVLASNHLVALLADSQELLLQAGADPAAAGPAFQALVTGTVENVYSAGPVAAFTGPLERADVQTIRNHLQALKRFPGIRERYRCMAAGALELARKRHPERREAYDELEKLLAEWQSK